MQPTYIPWIGYFAMIERADTFVFFDSVQFNRRSWQQRNRIKTAQGEHMLIVPVIKEKRDELLIKDVKIQHDQSPCEKHKQVILQAYRKAPHFSTYFPELESLYDATPSHLSTLNESIIIWLCKCFNIETNFVHSHTLSCTGKKDDLLASICEELQFSNYLSAPGSKEYIEASDGFSSRGISVQYHNYTHTEYSQLYPPFVPYMGAIDLLFNEGPKSKDVLLKGLN